MRRDSILLRKKEDEGQVHLVRKGENRRTKKDLGGEIAKGEK